MHYITINKQLITDFSDFHLNACNDPFPTFNPLPAINYSPTRNIADRIIKIKTFSHPVTYPMKLSFCFFRRRKPGNISKPF